MIDLEAIETLIYYQICTNYFLILKILKIENMDLNRKKMIFIMLMFIWNDLSAFH